jgi:ATP-dependent protease HslVU (ClpYQ) ATPase subunit
MSMRGLGRFVGKTSTAIGYWVKKEVVIAYDNRRYRILGQTRNLKPLRPKKINLMGNTGFEPVTPSV